MKIIRSSVLLSRSEAEGQQDTGAVSAQLGVVHGAKRSGQRHSSPGAAFCAPVQELVRHELFDYLS